MKKEYLVTVGIVLLFLCAVILLLGTLRVQHQNLETRQSSDDDSDEENIRLVVRSLAGTQEDKYDLIQRKSVMTDTVIAEKTPWLPKTNFVSNTFLNRKKHGNKLKSDIGRPAVVLVQHPRSAGVFLHDCLSNISFEHDLAMSPVMNMKNRALWDAGNPDTSSFKNSIQIHRGHYAFGMCENLETKCAHIAIIRDPFKRSISTYNHCKNNHQIEACSAINANKVSLRQWILEQGSTLFNQLLFSSHLCSDTDSIHVNLSSVPDSVINKKRLPCWYKQKMALGQKLTGSDVTLLTDYVLDHLSDWFAVIGIFDDIDTSLLMFEKALALPFTKCNSYSNSKRGYDNWDNRANQDTVEPIEIDDEDIDEENDPSYLIDDELVLQALESDIRIYKKAKQIFHIQSQILLNKVHN